MQQVMKSKMGSRIQSAVLMGGVALLLAVPALAGGTGTSKGAACADAFRSLSHLSRSPAYTTCDCVKESRTWTCDIRPSSSGYAGAEVGDGKTKTQACAEAWEKVTQYDRYGFDYGDGKQSKREEGPCECEETAKGYECVQYYTMSGGK